MSPQATGGQKAQLVPCQTGVPWSAGTVLCAHGLIYRRRQAAPTADRNYLKQLPDVVSELGFTTCLLVSSHLLLEFSLPQRVQGPGANPTGLAQLPGGALLFGSVVTLRGARLGAQFPKLPTFLRRYGGSDFRMSLRSFGSSKNALECSV